MPRAALGNRDAAGGVLIPGQQSFFRCDGELLIVIGDRVAPHGDAPHGNAVVTAGSSTTRINGIPIVRAGDPASCGHACSGSATLSVD